ncbi:MAG: 3-oxoacyl-ACP synthase [Bacteroidetes bacterium]|jgi:3-oxoacyl-[acyl-carrier-protein] synthase-3|nr:3-oxoacyl-ACP synthase [Bacteroidota bacterium]MAC04577.1 3-oxoacyl-ACP synthase [Balneola sp.]MAO76715.1 3-oxoacyl-ACP synthase [Balneola sp.]MBF65122.1 3-oxoacyl-ACP synthase [Balneola sp.]HAW81307.1 3-oxoacyl-ACP synthase [Balneola sp.]|tara:strand:- start:4089 stop:5081 length:993 start_codon:yes stop_codon:yes gene_type:complete
MEVKQAKITAVGHYLPEFRMTNFELEKLMDTNDEWIRTRTGISERRILKDPDKATAFMGAEAAKEALANANVDASEIDLVILATVTPDYLFPATACLVQNMIGATNAFAFDLSAACSGFLYALSTGSMYIEAGRAKKVLVIGSDKMSSILDYTDRTTSILFGDGAGAVLLEESSDGTGLIDQIHYTEGDTNCSLYQHAGGSRNPASKETVENKQHYITQDGRAVFKKATMGMADVSLEIMKKNNLDPEDVAWLVPHQANLRIIDATANRMGLSSEKVMININKYGNTTAGTIPLCLYDWKEKLNHGDNLILAAFGGGFTWGAIYLKWGIK